MTFQCGHGGTALVPRRDRHVGEFLHDLHEPQCTARLRAFQTFAVQSQADNHLAGAMLDGYAQDGARVRFARPMTQNEERAGYHAQFVAERKADARLTRVDSQDATQPRLSQA